MKSLVLLLLMVAAAISASAQSSSGITFAADKKVSVLDDCDPNDPAWGVNGCGITAKEGDVLRSEFNLLLLSPLSLSTVGHPSWRIEPSYFTIEPDKTVRVTNEGGRGHTFTKVANFGGGFVAPLNVGLTPAPECTGAVPLQPGQSRELTTELTEGLNRFQCCIHPWMRATIKVKAKH